MSITSKTITLTGEEIAVKFDKQYPYFWVQNLGKSDVYMSVKPGIVPDSDGVKLVPAGGGKSSGEVNSVDTLYLLGSGKVEVNPQFNAICPYAAAGNVSGGTTGPIDYNDLENKPDLSVYVKKEDCQFMTEAELSEIIANAKGE